MPSAYPIRILAENVLSGPSPSKRAFKSSFSKGTSFRLMACASPSSSRELIAATAPLALSDFISPTIFASSLVVLGIVLDSVLRVLDMSPPVLPDSDKDSLPFDLKGSYWIRISQFQDYVCLGSSLLKS